MNGKRWLYFATIFHPLRLYLVRTRELFKATTMVTATKTSLNIEVKLVQALSGLFYIVHFVKRCQFTVLELSSKGLYRSSGKEKESRNVLCSPQNVKLGIFTS